MAETPGCSAGVDGPHLQLDLTAARSHLLRVDLHLSPRMHQLELRMPGWTPGSYLMRDYVRTLENLVVRQGEFQVPAERTAPATWRLRLQNLGPVQVSYRILATELSVRTCHLDGDHGFLVLAGVALQVVGERWRPHTLEVRLPPGWEAFLPLPKDGQGFWKADDYDQLVDAPLEAGPHPCHGFSVGGVPHRWVSWGGDLPVSDPSWLGDVTRVCEACCTLMGEPSPPGSPYLFVLHLGERGHGGLEHDRASVLRYGRRALAQPDGRRKLLQLVAHEYLHQWNVRRLRPAELTPIDYDHPVVVPTLWFAEGVTSYYDQFLPLLAGLGDEAALLEDLGADLSRYLGTPGRSVQSLRSSSQEAWVKLYRQDAHSSDNQISYYLKGAVVALVLDLHLRRLGGALSVVLRELWQRYGRQGRGYREDDLIATFADHAEDLSFLLPQWLNSTEDPPLESYLADVGLKLIPQPSEHLGAGWQVEGSDSLLRLARVERGGAAETAGLQVGDELIAVEGQRLRLPEDVGLQLRPPAKPLEVLFCRDGRTRITTLEPGAPPILRWRLESDGAAGADQLQSRRRWLSLLP